MERNGTFLHGCFGSAVGSFHQGSLRIDKILGIGLLKSLTLVSFSLLTA